MIYTVKEYKEKYHPDKSIDTVQRLIRAGHTPSNHYVKKGHDYMIFVGSEHEFKAAEYFDACTEFHRLKKGRNHMELVAELSIHYDLSITKMCKLLGL